MAKKDYQVIDILHEIIADVCINLRECQAKFLACLPIIIEDVCLAL